MRKRCKGKPDEQIYQSKKSDLQELEKLSQQGQIDLFYGDESRVSSEGYVPYGWQFPDEKVAVYTEKGYKVNILGLISRSNQCYWETTQQNIDAKFIVNHLDKLSLKIRKHTVVVLDNSSVHQSKLLNLLLPIWQNRGLFVFFLPTYSPHLNIAETMWRKLKCEWLVPEDYLEKDNLLYAVNCCMDNIGNYLKINFSPFNAN
ncbi:MAG: IS630 family transposase [Sphingobacteriales bacterium]|nr:MAG: IS630 family transposase [Sphingobacteriales bacterium]